MEALLRDLRFGLRMIVKNPLLSSISIVTFALGIGLTTTVYSIVNGALLDGLPFEESNRIVRVLRTDLSRNSQPIGVSVHDYFDWREQQTSFVHMAGLSGRAVNVIDSEGQPVRYDAAEVTPEFFDILGVYPFMGRSFDENDSEVGATSTVILSWDAWQEEFEGNDAVVGRTIQMDGTTGTVIGVMPEDFAFPDRQRIWVPMRLDASVQRDQGRNLAVMARLADGVSLDEAGAQMVTIASRLATEYPETNENLSAEVDTYINIDVGDEIAGFLYTMLAAVLGVLLIACANVANLLLARASTRTREVAVRTALGASRGQVIRQLLTETIVLAFVGSAIGIAIGYAGVGWFNRAIAISPPPAWMTFAVDGNVMVFIVIITALAAIGSGLMPAIQATRTDVGEILKDEGRGASSMRVGKFSSFLVVAEITLSCALLAGAGLMIKSVVQLGTLPMPFAVDEVFTARLNLPATDYPEITDRVRFYEELQPVLATLPGVEGATLSDGLPASGNGSLPIEVEGVTYQTEEDYPNVREGIVTPGYFETFAVPMIQGRGFAPSDRADAPPVAVVNESFVRQLIPDGSALGSRFKIRFDNRPEEFIEIVGVVPDLYMEGIGNNEGNPWGYYIPIAQTGVGNFVSMAVRTSGNPMAVTRQVRDAVASVDSNLPIFRVMHMADVIRQATWFYSVFGTLFMVFGFCALFLAAVGLYGVMSFAVGNRQHEMGIRMALGATGRTLVSLVMRRGLFQIGAGMTLGLGLAALVTSPLQLVLYRVNARDPLVFGAIVVTLGLTGLVASLIPARRVTTVDPVAAMRSQ